MSFNQWIFCGVILLYFVVQASAQCTTIQAELGVPGSIQVPEDGVPNYPVNLDECWKISSPNAQPLLTQAVASVGPGDELKVANGDNDQNPHVVTNNQGSTYTKAKSTGTAVVTFKTDATLDAANDKSIRVRYLYAFGTDCNAQVVDATTQTQYLASPNFPEDYNKNMNCEWEIKAADPTSKILFKMIYMNIELQSDCTQRDYLQITDSTGIKSAAICGENWTPDFNFTTSENAANITFVSDSFDQKAGFVLAYTEIRMSTENTTELSGMSTEYTTELSGTTVESTTKPVSESKTTDSTDTGDNDDKNGGGSTGLITGIVVAVVVVVLVVTIAVVVSVRRKRQGEHHVVQGAE